LIGGAEGRLAIPLTSATPAAPAIAFHVSYPFLFLPMQVGGTWCGTSAAIGSVYV
jgi:hypothetical protein